MLFFSYNTVNTVCTSNKVSKVNKSIPPPGWWAAVHTVLLIKSNFRVAHLNICAAGQLLKKAQSIIEFFARKN